MNYLAHIYLSGDDPKIRIGGLLGDFVKGSLKTGPLKNHYPQCIEQGIALHRAIDSWFDQQPQIINARARFQPPFRRFADNAPRVKLLESYTRTDAIATALVHISHRFATNTAGTGHAPCGT